MADKTTKIIEIEVELEGGEKVTKQFEQLADGTQKAVDSAEKLDAKFEDVYRNIEPLTTRMGEAEDRLYELALAGDTTSKEYQELLASVGNYRKVQIQTDLAVDQAANTFSQKLGGAITGATSGFAAVQGAMALVGSESEALEQTLLKVQGALALQQGVQGVLEYSKSIGLASKATKAFNAIVRLNPLALLVTTMVAIIGYFAVFTDAIGTAIQGLKDLGDAIGITGFAEEKRAKRQEEIATRQAEYRKAEIEYLKAQGKNTAELEKQILREALAIKQREKERFAAFNNKQLEIAADTEILKLKAQIAAIDKAEAERLKAEAEARKQRQQEELERLKKLNEEVQKAFEERIDTENKILQEGVDFLKNANFEEVESTFNKYSAMGEISMQYYKDEEERRKEDRENLFEGIEKGLEYAQQGADALQQLSDLVFSNKMSKLEKGSKAEEELARKQFKFNKALQLGGAVIDAAKAINSSLAQSPIAIGPVPNPAGIASLAFAATTGALNIAKIASAKFESTSTDVDTPTPDIGGGGAPQFNVVGDSGVNQLAQLQQQPTQAYVVSGEVTTAQALDRNRVQNATL
jgi:hypothetical protein